MKIVTTAAATLLVGLMAGLAAQAQIQPTQVNMTHDPTHRWGEPVIAANPKNPKNLVAAVNVGYICKSAEEQACRLVRSKSNRTQPYGLLNNVPRFTAVDALVSSDRGKTWNRIALPTAPPGHPDIVTAGHPTATASADGTFYIAYNAIHFEDLEASPVSHGGIAVTKSSDGGKTWSAPVFAGTPLDHPYITSDLSTGKIYVSSGAPGELGRLSTGDPKATQSEVRDRFLVSSSDGVHWTAPEPFGGYTGGGPGSAAANFIPFVSAANGVLAAAFRSTNASACGAGVSLPCTVFETTRDAGEHWSKASFPAPTTYNGGPIMAADPSKPGHFTIALLMNSDTEFDVYQTHDSGETWSGSTKISEDSGKMHFHGWMAYSPTGVLGIVWKTRDAAPTAAAAAGLPAPSAAPYNVWAAISRDGGTTFSEPLKVSSAASPGSPPRLFATDSLSSMVVGPQEVFVSWGDWRTGELSSFFSAIKLNAFKLKD